MEDIAANVMGSGMQGGGAKTVRWESNFAGDVCGTPT